MKILVIIKNYNRILPILVTIWTKATIMELLKWQNFKQQELLWPYLQLRIGEEHADTVVIHKLHRTGIKVKAFCGDMALI